MKNQFEKIPAKFKVKCEDFIVEELAWGEDAKISSEDNFNKKPDLTNLEKESKREFIICELEKRDIDTFRAKKELASALRKGVDSLGLAGIKDKKAHTSQRISIFNPDLETLENFSHEQM
jgi:TruD family tRNA pseudouridine synthase